MGVGGVGKVIVWSARVTRKAAVASGPANSPVASVPGGRVDMADGTTALRVGDPSPNWP